MFRKLQFEKESNFYLFQSIRKTIFMSIVLLMILCYAGFYFVPIIPSRKIAQQSLYNFTEISSDCDKHLTVISKHAFFNFTQKISRPYYPQRFTEYFILFADKKQ